MNKMYSFFRGAGNESAAKEKNMHKCCFFFVFFRKQKCIFPLPISTKFKNLLNKPMEIHLPKDRWKGKMLVDELRKEGPKLVMVEYKKMKGGNDSNFSNKLVVPNLLEWDL